MQAAEHPDIPAEAHEGEAAEVEQFAEVSGDEVLTVEILDDLDWCRREDAPVKANLTEWNISDYLPDLCSQLYVLFPNYKIEDLWIASYGLGDDTESRG